jgi:predicted nucleic acid-binding protein
MLFETPRYELSDEEVVAILRQSMASAGRLPRHADLWLAGICAEHLVDGLRAVGLIVARPAQWRLHP